MSDDAPGPRERIAAVVAGPLCLSPPVVWTFVSVTLGVTIGVDIIQRDGDPRWWLPVGVLSIAITTGGLIAARAVLRPSRWDRPRLALVLGLYAAAGFIRSGLIALAIERGGGRLGESLGLVGASPASRLAGGAAIVVLSLSLASAATHSAERHRRIRAQLESTERRLIALASTMQERVAAARLELASEARAQLAPTMDEVRARLDRLPEGDQADEIAQMLSDAVTTVIRPMSHSLVEREVRAIIEDVEPNAAEGHRRGADIDIVESIRPTWTVGLSSALALLLAPFWMTTPQTVAVVIAGSLLVWALLWAIRRLWPRRWRRLGRGVALPALVAIYTTVMLPMPLLALPLTDESLSRPLLGVAVVARVAIGMAVSSVVIIEAARRAAEERLVVQNHELEQLVAALRRELWATKRQLALALHGPLQSTLVSSALLLSRAGTTEADLATVRDRVEQALAHIDSGGQHAASIELALGETAALWSDSCEVAWSVTEAAAHKLRQDAGLTVAAAEIVREGVSNAVRHGGAAHVVVSISTEGELVHVQVRDDGRVRRGTDEPGLGSRVLDEVALRWDRELGDSGALLTADLR